LGGGVLPMEFGTPICPWHRQLILVRRDAQSVRSTRSIPTLASKLPLKAAASDRQRDPSPTLDRPGGRARNKPGLETSRTKKRLLTFCSLLRVALAQLSTRAR
jgi:hypothetical protein